MDTTYLSPGNSKTGDCWSFDIPAVDTCPGSTAECREDCYAVNLMCIYQTVDAKYRRNKEITYHPNFVDYMIETIPRNSTGRLHVSGDFFHADYVQKWIDICGARPDVYVYCYTRSWRVHDIFPAIITLHALPNVNVNLSVDDETGSPANPFYDLPDVGFYRWCYLAKTDKVPGWVRHDDIVFRSNHKGHKIRRKNAIKKGETPPPLVKRLGGQVCPMEQGQSMSNFSCAKCRLCIDKPR